MSVLLIHYNSVKSKLLLKILKNKNYSIIEYNPYTEYLTQKKLYNYSLCDSLILSGMNVKMKTIKIPLLTNDRFGKSFFERISKIIKLFEKKKILGICYGSQLLWHYYGGNTLYYKNIYGYTSKEHTNKIIFTENIIFNNLKKDNSFVFNRNILLDKMNIPHKCNILAKDKQSNIAAFVINKNIYGVLFHPEVSGEYGDILLTNFLKLNIYKN